MNTHRTIQDLVLPDGTQINSGVEFNAKDHPSLTEALIKVLEGNSTIAKLTPVATKKADSKPE
ncbi:MAG TPA: hypothetical protein IGS53_12730 [Leptolyngbyaceae cyanobacterium M33_DOE_097]|uniref:Uncharacterized protein n=1 Tax=Oscillatoriales cyanobacterium SpSt-418 TaxID=2282169 RepID=A0A7C3KFG8_9CYAN|nr:hypothetical protein [Leptolyngbyaceae cyanobacterium M33_DOE_097]